MVTVILGTPRSGTSMAARALNLAGVYLGEKTEMVTPATMNPRGFWEHSTLLHISDQILAYHGGSWYAPPRLPPGWEASTQSLPLFREAQKTLISLARYPNWGWKDPRLSLTLPFWRQALNAALPPQEPVHPLRCVICVRNPLAVADSQMTASQANSMPMPREQALALWRVFTEAALRNTRAEERVVLFYEDLLQNWRRTLPPVLEQVGISPLSAAADGAIEAFADHGLQHHHHTPEEALHSTAVPFYVQDLYAALRAGPEATEGWLRASPPGESDPLLSLQLRSYAWEMEARRLSSILSSPPHRLVHRLAPAARRFEPVHTALTRLMRFMAPC